MSVSQGQKALDVSNAVGDYLKAIWLLRREGRATTNAIAARLGFTPASVSGMLARLSEMGLVEHVRYRGATLTKAGEREAIRLVRRHRLVETFMIEELGYGWDEVHEEAEMLEHAVSDRFAERLAVLLNHPTHDPHGDPIPSAKGEIPRTPDEHLSRLTPGTSIRVSRLRSQDAQVLTQLAAAGIVPGAVVKVEEHDRVSGAYHVVVERESHVLPAELAQYVRGELLS